MKKILLFYVLFVAVILIQAQPAPVPENSGMPSADPLPMPYLLYPYPDKEVAFVQEDFICMWEIDSLKYPPEKYDFRYDFLLVRVEKGQKPQEAIEKNQPLYEERDIPAYYVRYPWNAEKLSDGSSYAWRVTSKNKSEEFLHSEISTFTINDKLEKYVLLKYSNYYTELREKLDAGFQVAYDRKLFFTYEELYEVGSGQNLRFRVYNDASNTLVQTNENGMVITGSAPSVPLQTGINYLILNLETAVPINWGTFYILEVWNAKNERWYLKFTTAYSNPVFIAVPYTPGRIR